MNPLWFSESVYLANKLDQLQRNGEDYASVQDVSTALQVAGLTPYAHYAAYGNTEGVNPNLYFNKTEYLLAKANQLNTVKQDGKTNWDAAAVEKAFDAVGLSAAEHFSLYGWLENVNPSNDFDVSTYLEEKAAAMGNGTTVASLKKIFSSSGMDPVGHYMAIGRMEGMHSTEVPLEEQVAIDPSRPRPAVLSEDGKTITLHLQSPIVTSSIEKEDFSVKLGDTVLTVDKVNAGTDKINYDVLITLADVSRLPGLAEGESSNLQVVYNPAGGPKNQLTCESGIVPAFAQPVENQSRCFLITERVSTENKTITTTVIDPITHVETSTTTTITVSTLNLNLTPPANYVQPTELAQYVKVDLAATSGVVSGGAYGIVTAPRLMDGKLVQKLDATGVSAEVRLDIVAGTGGSEITTSDAADHISLGAGVDKVNYTSLTSSQLSHMETIEKFTCSTDELFFGNPKAATPTPLIEKVTFMGPLSLEGVINEASIKGVFWNTTMDAKTAYLLQNGKEYIMVADANGDGVFTAESDFALQLLGLSGAPTAAVPGADLTTLFIAQP